MRRLSFMVLALCMSTASVSAESWRNSVETRADALSASLQGNHSYEANLAREFADIALDEKSQHDTDIAKAFMTKAEEHAAKAGAAK